MLKTDDKTTRCLLCGEDSLVPRLMEGRFQVVACSRCGLAWRLDQPAHQPADGIQAAMPVEMSIAEMEEISLFRQPPGLLLNVGRNNSDLLETARMYGFQPRTVSALEDCAESVSPRRYNASDPDTTYDVIRLEGALENDPDPRSLLARAACLLGEKGLLVITAADFSEWEYPLHAEGASLLPPDLPRWFFSPHALERLLDQCGWKVLKLSQYQVPQSPFAFGPSLDSAVPPHPGAILPAFSAFPAQTVQRFRILARRHEMRRPLALVERARQPWSETIHAALEM